MDGETNRQVIHKFRHNSLARVWSLLPLGCMGVTSTSPVNQMYFGNKLKMQLRLRYLLNKQLPYTLYASDVFEDFLLTVRSSNRVAPKTPGSLLPTFSYLYPQVLEKVRMKVGEVLNPHGALSWPQQIDPELPNISLKQLGWAVFYENVLFLLLVLIL